MCICQKKNADAHAHSQQLLAQGYNAVHHAAAQVHAAVVAGQAHFRADITLDPGPLGAAQLLPGMPVQVFIRTGTHSPIAYLTAPLRGYLERALRE